MTAHFSDTVYVLINDIQNIQPNEIFTQEIMCCQISILMIFKTYNQIKYLLKRFFDMVQVQQSGGINLVLWAQTVSFSAMVLPCNSFPHVSK
jgi:hypothetical protein